MANATQFETGGVVYPIKDATARSDIADLKSSLGNMQDLSNYTPTAPEYTSHYSAYVHSDGAIAQQTNELLSYYEYQVTGGEIYYVVLGGSWSYFPAIVFYAGDEFLSSISRSNAFQAMVTVPTTATKMRINVNRWYPHNILKYNFSLEKYAEKPLLWASHSASEYVSSGLIISNANAMGTNIEATFVQANFTHATIPVNYGDTGRVVVKPSLFSYGAANVITFLDANNKMVGNQSYTASEDIVLSSIPSTAEYVVVNYDNVSNPLFSKAVATTIEEYAEKFGQWYGKKIVWFGTSISACGYIGKNNPNAIPQKVGDKLGATVINEAIGSSCVHAKYPERINQTTNPYGFYQNFEKVSRCLTNTLAEMEWIISNYNSSVFTTGTVSTMTTELANQIRANSYENKLDQYLTADNFPDLFVFEHGYNDWWNNKAAQDAYYEQYGDSQMYSYRAGMDFLIKRILDYNPKAKIVLIGNYCGHGDAGTLSGDVPAMQEEVQKDWNLPMIKQWDRLGWTALKTINPYGHWVNGVWQSDTTRHEMTVLQSWLPDGVHPHTDVSGKAVTKMVEEITTYLKNEVSLT